MFTCVLCRFEVLLDDAVTPTAAGRCVCVRCFARETETERRMSRRLRLELMDALDEAQVT